LQNDCNFAGYLLLPPWSSHTPHNKTNTIYYLWVCLKNNTPNSWWGWLPYFRARCGSIIQFATKIEKNVTVMCDVVWHKKRGWHSWRFVTVHEKGQNPCWGCFVPRSPILWSDPRCYFPFYNDDLGNSFWAWNGSECLCPTVWDLCKSKRVYLFVWEFYLELFKLSFE